MCVFHPPPQSLRIPPCVLVGLKISVKCNVSLVEGGLLHDSEEFVLVDLSVAVPVGLVDHLLELLVGHVFPELLGDALEVAEGNLSSLVIVKEAEGLEDLLAGVLLGHLRGHHFKELGEVNGSRSVLVNVGDHLWEDEKEEEEEEVGVSCLV